MKSRGFSYHLEGGERPDVGRAGAVWEYPWRSGTEFADIPLPNPPLRSEVKGVARCVTAYGRQTGRAIPLGRVAIKQSG